MQRRSQVADVLLAIADADAFGKGAEGPVQTNIEKERGEWVSLENTPCDLNWGFSFVKSCAGVWYIVLRRRMSSVGRPHLWHAASREGWPTESKAFLKSTHETYELLRPDLAWRTNDLMMVRLAA